MSVTSIGGGNVDPIALMELFAQTCAADSEAARHRRDGELDRSLSLREQAIAKKEEAAEMELASGLTGAFGKIGSGAIETGEGLSNWSDSVEATKLAEDARANEAVARDASERAKLSPTASATGDPTAAPSRAESDTARTRAALDKQTAIDARDVAREAKAKSDALLRDVNARTQTANGASKALGGLADAGAAGFKRAQRDAEIAASRLEVAADRHRKLSEDAGSQAQDLKRIRDQQLDLVRRTLDAQVRAGESILRG